VKVAQVKKQLQNLKVVQVKRQQLKVTVVQRAAPHRNKVF
jgi:hypothetical protein